MKKKMQDRFPLCHRGYDKDAVNSFIALEEAKAQEVQSEQRERINGLRSENDRLKREIALLKGREDQIKLALVNATDNAKRLDADVARRYEEELKRLRLFRAKWINVYEQLKERYHFDKDALNIESVAVSVELELKKLLAKDFALDKAPVEDEMEEHFRKEVERLSNLPQSSSRLKGDSSQANRLKNTLEEAAQKERKDAKDVGAFSLDEALSPQASIQQNCQAVLLTK